MAKSSVFFPSFNLFSPKLKIHRLLTFFFFDLRLRKKDSPFFFCIQTLLQAPCFVSVS